MRRWATHKTYITNDREELNHITIYPEDSDKVSVKAENRNYSYTRLLLVPEKDNNTPGYRLAKISRV